MKHVTIVLPVPVSITRYKMYLRVCVRVHVALFHYYSSIIDQIVLHITRPHMLYVSRASHTNSWNIRYDGQLYDV